VNVKGRFDDGNDKQLDMKNVPGEWCIAYHGTKQKYVKSITEGLLKAEQNNFFGYGIYCSSKTTVPQSDA
jgi:hypothetical protein